MVPRFAETLPADVSLSEAGGEADGGSASGGDLLPLFLHHKPVVTLRFGGTCPAVKGVTRRPTLRR